jgi:hypothetical protein
MTNGEHGECGSQLHGALPSHFPVVRPSASPTSLRLNTNNVKRGQLTLQQRQAIATRVERESLRALAKEYGVSHETIRRVAHHVDKYDM